MKYWNHYIIGAGLMSMIGYIVSNPLMFGICNRIYTFNDKLGCLDSSIENLGQPLLVLSSTVFAFMVLLYFFGNKVRLSWLRFAAWWIPLSIVVIYIGSSGGGGLMPFYSYSPSEMATPMAALFAAISLGIIAWKQFKSKK